ncbi:MAG: translation initiation factor IF-3 [Candidatus Paceibacterota bacterium]
MIKARINHQIRASELRVIGPEGENLGVITLSEAIKKASDLGLDLIEISPNANPPIGKIMDFGKYQYDEKKKEKEAKSHAHTVEVKTIQIKIGTGEHDLGLKAKKISEWLKEGNRVKIELFLMGRAKYLDKKFLEERLERVLKFVTEEYKMTEAPQKGLKGLSVMIEKKK